MNVAAERRSALARAVVAQTPPELEAAIREVERLVGRERDPELESVLRGLDARFGRATRDSTPIHQTGCFYHPERDPGFDSG